MKLDHKLHNRNLRKGRIRSKINGSSKRPRLSVYISNLHVSAQLIDDENGKTLAYVSTIGQKAQASLNLTDKASWVGAEIAKQAKTAKIKQVVFDRNGKLYHGRVAALATAARTNGLEF